MSFEELLETKLRAIVREELQALKSTAPPPAATPPPTPGLLTVAGAALASGFSEKTIRRWIKDKSLRSLSTPSGREYRIRPEDLAKCLSPAPSPQVDMGTEVAGLVTTLKRGGGHGEVPRPKGTRPENLDPSQRRRR